MSYSLTETVKFLPANQSAFGTLETAELEPVYQGDFVYGLNTQGWGYTYKFTVTDPATDPVAGDQYSNSNQIFTVIYNTGTTLFCYGTGSPAASGNLTRVSGAGTTPIAYSAFTSQAGVTSGTGATIDTDSARLRIQSGTGSTNFAYIQTRRPIRYRAGQGQVVRFTPLFTAGVANNVQLWGMGGMSGTTPYDGYFFGYNGTSFGICHYTRGTPAWSTRAADWNGDKVDGSAGTSFTWDPTKGTPVMIKYPYLGFGDIQFFVQNPSTGAWVLVHTIRYANTVATTQLSNPTLYFTGYTVNSGNTTNQTMYCASVGMFISGVRSFIGNPKWGYASSTATVTTENVIISLRNATTYNTITNRGLIRITSVSFSSSAANGIAILRMKLGATVGGTPSFAAISGTTSDGGATITSGNSIASVDIAGTTVSGGNLLFNLVADNPNSDVVDLMPYGIFVAPGEILTISGYSSVSSTIGVAINWAEDV